MGRCEFHREYFDYLNTRVASELINTRDTGRPDPERQWSGVWNVSLNIAICRSCEQITAEEADRLYKEVIGLYPQFEERLREELEKKFGPREIVVVQ